jgi:hypothetical protein
LEKLLKYKSVNGLLYDTCTDAVIGDFSCDDRVEKISAALDCCSHNVSKTLWRNRKPIRELLKEMENIIDEEYENS